MQYNELNYLTPDSLKNKHYGKRGLVIGSGESTVHLIPHKEKIKNYFDVVIGTNRTVEEFEEHMDYHLIVEKNAVAIYKPMVYNTVKYRRDLPRIVNWKGIHRFPKDINIYKITRCSFDDDTNLREYKNNGREGLLIGPKDSKGLSAGSVSMQAFHLACIMGCSEIFLIGTELLFKKKDRDHFYKSSTYRKSTTKLANRSPIVTVKHNGKKYDSTEFFINSAKFFNYVITKYCSVEGIRVYDFSDGLIKKAINLNLEDFLMKGKV